MKTLLDHHLHKLSLDLAAAFKDCWARGEKDIATDLLTAYRNVRRHISRAKNGKRHGSREAYIAMQS
jgi:hypothetical protein